MAVIPVGTALLGGEAVGVGRARLDAVKADTGHTVLAERQDQSVPVDRRRLAQVVFDVQGDVFTLFEAQNGRNLAIIIADALFLEVTGVDADVVDTDVIGSGSGAEPAQSGYRQPQKGRAEHGNGIHFHSFQKYTDESDARARGALFACLCEKTRETVYALYRDDKSKGTPPQRAA